MKVISAISYPNEQILDCDFNPAGQAALLLNTSSNEKRAIYGQAGHSSKDAWFQYTQRIKWADSESVYLWPAAPRQDMVKSIVQLSQSSMRDVNFGRPMKLFTGAGIAVASYSEDQILYVRGAPLEKQSDVIAAFRVSSGQKVARFVDIFVSQYPTEDFIEIENGVIDEEGRRFYFTAYDSSALWCFDVLNKDVYRCELHVSRSDVIAISCDDKHITVLKYGERNLEASRYIREDASLRHAENDSIIVEGAALEMFHSEPQSRMRGYAHNRISVVDKNRALLLEL